MGEREKGQAHGPTEDRHDGRQCHNSSERRIPVKNIQIIVGRQEKLVWRVAYHAILVMGSAFLLCFLSIQ
jgi:hypothetical protein